MKESLLEHQFRKEIEKKTKDKVNMYMYSSIVD